MWSNLQLRTWRRRGRYLPSVGGDDGNLRRRHVASGEHREHDATHQVRLLRVELASAAGSDGAAPRGGGHTSSVIQALWRRQGGGGGDGGGAQGPTALRRVAAVSAAPRR